MIFGAAVIREQIRRAILKTRDRESRQHMESAVHRIGTMLDPKA